MATWGTVRRKKKWIVFQRYVFEEILVYSMPKSKKRKIQLQKHKSWTTRQYLKQAHTKTKKLSKFSP